MSTERVAEAPASTPQAAFHMAVLDTLSEPIAVIDLQGTIAFVNLAWRRCEQENGSRLTAANPVGLNYLAMCLAGEVIEATTQELQAVCLAIDAPGLQAGAVYRQLESRGSV